MRKFFSLVCVLFVQLSALSVWAEAEKNLPAKGLTCKADAILDVLAPKAISFIQVKATQIPKTSTLEITYLNKATGVTIENQSDYVIHYQRLETPTPKQLLTSEFGLLRRIAFFSTLGTKKWRMLVSPYRWEVGIEKYFVAGFDCTIND